MKLAVERLNKVFQLPPGERVILGQAWALFLLAELALRILPFRRLLALSDKVFLKGRGEPALELLPSAARLAWLVEVAGRYTPMRATCLKKALVLSWLLGRTGTQTELQIGIARYEGTFKAHAWLNYGGQVILGHQQIERYETLLRA